MAWTTGGFQRSSGTPEVSKGCASSLTFVGRMEAQIRKAAESKSEQKEDGDVTIHVAGEVTMLRLQADVKFDTGDKEESAELLWLPAARWAGRRVLAPLRSADATKHEGLRKGYQNWGAVMTGEEEQFKQQEVFPNNQIHSK
ncbi:hypothetical protein lerEdw1_011383 [Lerista edwardsae]|nr:hypothetical protein lerEdw1_011383 [Lerista edwardsae]